MEKVVLRASEKSWQYRLKRIDKVLEFLGYSNQKIMLLQVSLCFVQSPLVTDLPAGWIVPAEKWNLQPHVVWIAIGLLGGDALVESLRTTINVYYITKLKGEIIIIVACNLCISVLPPHQMRPEIVAVTKKVIIRNKSIQWLSQ